MWQGATDTKGYGQINVDGNTLVSTHRTAWEIAFGPIPPGMYVLHSCDNPPCCNPAHLRLGTAKDNTRDMMQRGRNRNPRGSENAKALFTETDVQEIRRRHADGISSLRIARELGVSEGCIRHIVTRRTWRHVA